MSFFSGGWGPPPPSGCPFGFGSERPGFALALVCSSFIRPPITPSLSVTAIFCPLQTGYKRPLRIDPDSYFRSGFSSGRPNPQPTARSSVPVSEGRTSWRSPGAPSDTVGLRPSSHRGGRRGPTRWPRRAPRLTGQPSAASVLQLFAHMFWKVPAGDNRAPAAGVGHADAAGEPRRPWADVLTRARPGAPWPRSRSARGPSPQTRDPPTSEDAFPGTGVQGEGRPGAQGSSGVGGAGSGAPWGEQAAFRAAHGAPRSAPGGASRGPGITPSFLKRSRSGPAARGRGESEGVGAKSVLGSHRQRVPEGP